MGVWSGWLVQDTAGVWSVSACLAVGEGPSTSRSFHHGSQLHSGPPTCAKYLDMTLDQLVLNCNIIITIHSAT
ncbi:hypothetical protein DPEC_G00263500 [Dallia pectoralis]|uniref:Uncharacterized protein n=1 Tax=Dallia pectoralis TaxID=75939 RepID=A0ACC2FSB7_DALPE|nr:hypothetical protein DPEC_G00263500 [Dallia pectoralis]